MNVLLLLSLFLIVLVTAFALVFWHNEPSVRSTSINLAAQPAAFLDGVKPHLPADVQVALNNGTYWVTPQYFHELCEWYKEFYRQQAEAAAQQERAHRAEIAAIEAQNVRDAAQARKKFMRSLQPEERGLLEVQLHTMAEAEARAKFDFEALEQRNRYLSQEVARLREARPNDAIENELRQWIAARRGKQIVQFSGTWELCNIPFVFSLIEDSLVESVAKVVAKSGAENVVIEGLPDHLANTIMRRACRRVQSQQRS